MQDMATMRSDEEAETGAVKSRIERCFRQIETERMAGIPILNRALRVEVVGLQRFGEEWLSILITPWFMNVMLLPVSPGDGSIAGAASARAVGTKELVGFPAGRFEMIQGFEAAVGHYRMCSLFSPVLEFADHESAVLAAEAALASLLQSDADDHTDAAMEMIWRGERPAVGRGEEVPDASTIGGEPTPADRVGHSQDGGSVTALSRRGLLLGRLRTEGQREL